MATPTASVAIVENNFNGDIKSEVEKGIDLLLAHFKAAGQILFPRKMATYLKYGIMVRSKEDILTECEKASFIDCRISAYPFVVDSDIDAGLVAPTILFCDIDKKLFATEADSNQVLKDTLQRIKETFGGIEPTVLSTGNGYHIYIVINTKSLNLHARLVKFCPHNTEVNKEFLRFIEWYLTDGKCDPEHAATLSFKSCLLRIPFTFNSKCIEATNSLNQADPQVKIISESIGIGELDKEIIREFRHNLLYKKIDLKNKEASMKIHELKVNMFQDQIDRQKYAWIEKLANTPLAENRYFVIFHLIAPYYRRILKLSYEEAEGKIREWLIMCNKLNYVNNMDNKIAAVLKNAHNFKPTSLERLKEENEKRNNLYKNILDAVM